MLARGCIHEEELSQFVVVIVAASGSGYHYGFSISHYFQDLHGDLSTFAHLEKDESVWITLYKKEIP
jgi:hypothetical protein